MMHLPILQLLLELIPSILQPLTSSLNVIYRDTNVSEAFAWVLIAIVGLVGGVVFGAVVVSEFDDALAISPMVTMRSGFWGVVGEEV